MGEERRNELLDSPLYDFVKRGWGKWSQRIVALQVVEEDFLLYLAWALETIKEQEEGVNVGFRDRLYNALRSNFIERQFNSTNREDVMYLTDLVSAASLAVLGLTLTDSLDNQRIYSELVSGFGRNWDGIRELKSSADMDTQIPGLKAFAVSFLADDVFYTFSNKVEWNDNDMADQTIRKSKKFKKIDLFRVIIGLYEIGAFQSADGDELTLTKVFQAFGDMLGEDYSDFNNHLSSASRNKTEVNVFTRLAEGLEKYEEGKDEKLTKQGKPIRR